MTPKTHPLTRALPPALLFCLAAGCGDDSSPGSLPAVAAMASDPSTDGSGTPTAPGATPPEVPVAAFGAPEPIAGVQPSPPPAIAQQPVPEPEGVHRCGWGEPADPRDALIGEAYQLWTSPRGQVDLFMPQPVLDWMAERVWDESHDLWHAVRQCEMPLMGNSICRDRPDLVAGAQTCASARNGYEFLVMHHHMLLAMRQAFPGHPELFEGFEHFPMSADEIPEPLRDGFDGWSRTIRDTAAILDDIENHLDRFPTEGDLGSFMQCGAMSAGQSGVHAALHFKWAQFGSPRNLGDQTRNLGNYMFWKLHGWIDTVWLRYRAAKGLDGSASDDLQAELEAELEAQCWEMHDLGHVAIDRGLRTTSDSVDLPEESGPFHDVIRPILDDNCASCHSGSSPAAGLVLGGAVSSAQLVSSLLGRPTARGGEFLMVVPGRPDRSWLYLRAAGEAQGAGCTGDCSVGVMPPTGEVTLTQTELASLRDWIADTAAAP